MSSRDDVNRFIHCKEVIFDNGNTSVEYYYKPNSEILFITFDSVNIKKEDEPFGLRFLRTLDVDILAFRKRKKHGYATDFSYEMFDEVVRDIHPKYKRKIAYGFSLGAYAILYYASRIDCEIFAIAPRIPAHPIYGTKVKNKVSFNHDLHLKFNDKIKPVIAYDPYNKIDDKYFKNEIITNFPNLNLIKSNYAGHKVAQYYVQMNVLKQMVLSIYNGEDVKYDKKLRVNSVQYLSILSEVCLNKKKYKWASDIADKALKIDNNNKRANLVKYTIELEKTKCNLKKALSHARIIGKDEGELFIELNDLIHN